MNRGKQTLEKPMVCPKETIPYETKCINNEKVVEIFDSMIDSAFSEIQSEATFERYEPDTGYGGGWTLEKLDKIQDEFTKDVMSDFHFKEDALDEVKSAIASAFRDIERDYYSDDEGPVLSNSHRKEIANRLGGIIFAYKRHDEGE